MAELKTRKSNASVAAFLNAVEDKGKRGDCKRIAKMMRDDTGKRAKMWGESIVGFDSYNYTYESGHSGSWPICGFSPRAQNITVYIMPGFNKFEKILGKLGKFKISKSCLYIKKLDDIDQKVLANLIVASVKEMRRRYKSKQAES